MLRNWTYIKDKTNVRISGTDKEGGIICPDEKWINILRDVKWEILRMMGKKILSGDFDLTRISFPIKLAQPKTLLENVAGKNIFNPLYFGLACRSNSPIERMKFFAIH